MDPRLPVASVVRRTQRAGYSSTVAALQFGQFDDFEMEIYLTEIHHQVEAASLAITELNGSLARSGAGTVPRAFASAQALLGAAAMLSKLLWPTPGGVDSPGRLLSPGAAEGGARARARARGRELRRVLDNLKAPSPLETRRVRNAFEHFDERLDKYLYDSRGGQRLVVDRNIGPANMVMTPSGPPRYLRHINPVEGSISVLDDSVAVQPLVDAIADVGKRAERALDAIGASRTTARLVSRTVCPDAREAPRRDPS